MVKISKLSKRELKEKTGWNDRKIQALVESGKLRHNGKKYSKRIFFFEEEDKQNSNDGSLVEETIEEARRRKTIAEANLIELKHKCEQDRLFNEWTAEYSRVLFDSFAPFHLYVSDLRLGQEQAQKLTEIFSLCLKNLQKELEKVSPSRDL